ncbi:MAG: hypothetical protein JNM69_13095 [Archangium sp.]|nr:hypothetical protein [Archangium sp.]
MSPFKVVCSLVLLGLAACGGQVALIEDGALDEADSNEAPLSLSCVLGTNCPPVIPVITAFAPKTGPSASTNNATYWSPDAPAGRNVPRVAKTVTLSGLRLERDDLSVWLSSTTDGQGPLAADDILLVEVRSSSGSVLARQILAGPRLFLADKTTEVPSRPSTWDSARNGHVAPAFDLAPLLPRGRALTLKVSVLDLQGLTASGAVQLVVTPKVVTPPAPARDVADLFDTGARDGLRQAAANELLPYFTPGANESSPFKAVLVERRRVCNAVTGCGAWTASTNTTLESKMSVLPSIAQLPFRFDLGQTNRGYLMSLAIANAWNVDNVLLYSTLSTYTHTECVNAVSHGSYDTCFYFPFGQVKVTAGGLWAVSNTSNQSYGTGSTEQRQFAVFARFAAGELPSATFANQTWSVRW